MDFFVVPTATFRLLYVLGVMTHERRKVIPFNITDSSTAAWTARQIVNAFPYGQIGRTNVFASIYDGSEKLPLEVCGDSI